MRQFGRWYLQCSTAVLCDASPAVGATVWSALPPSTDTNVGWLDAAVAAASGSMLTIPVFVCHGREGGLGGFAREC